MYICGDALNIHIKKKGELMGKYRVEMMAGDEKSTLNLEGQGTIIKYTSEEIVISFDGRMLKVRGKALSMPFLNDEGMCVSGNIKNLDFAGESKDERLL